ncbi:MAG: hypothetical protein MJE68_21555, partial [Proteobacteria bacterium]|nr:hypothetical protein [Pseudomonadota bacterium]
PHPRATRVEEQQQLEGEGEGGGGGEDEGAGPCGVSGGGGSCEGGEAGEDGCDGTPREAMRWNLGGMCFGVYIVCVCVCKVPISDFILIVAMYIVHQARCILNMHA